MRKAWSLGPSGPKLKLVRACFVHLGRNSNSFRSPIAPETTLSSGPLARNSKSSAPPVSRHGTETRTRFGPRRQDHKWAFQDVQGVNLCDQLMFATGPGISTNIAGSAACPPGGQAQTPRKLTRCRSFRSTTSPGTCPSTTACSYTWRSCLGMLCLPGPHRCRLFSRRVARCSRPRILTSAPASPGGCPVRPIADPP